MAHHVGGAENLPSEEFSEKILSRILWILMLFSLAVCYQLHCVHIDRFGWVISLSCHCSFTSHGLTGGPGPALLLIMGDLIHTTAYFLPLSSSVLGMYVFKPKKPLSLTPLHVFAIPLQGVMIQQRHHLNSSQSIKHRKRN